MFANSVIWNQALSYTYAAMVAARPILGGRVASFDAADAQKLPGVKKVFAVPGYRGGTGGVVVIADTPYRAMRAVKTVRIEWDHGPSASVSTEDIYRQLAQTMDKEDGFGFYKHGDIDAALKGAAKVIDGCGMSLCGACTVHIDGQPTRSCVTRSRWWPRAR